MELYLEQLRSGYIPPLANGHRLYVYDHRGIAVRMGVCMGEEGDAVVSGGVESWVFLGLFMGGVQRGMRGWGSVCAYNEGGILVCVCDVSVSDHRGQGA